MWLALPSPSGKPDHEIGPDVADDILRDRLGVGEQFRHQMQARGAIGSERLELDAATCSYSVFSSDIRL